MSPWVNKGCEIRTLILDKTMRNQDHGILSAIMLLYEFRGHPDIYRFLFPAAAAISIHNFMWIDDKIFKVPCNKCVDVHIAQKSLPTCESCNKWNEAYDIYFKKWNKQNAKNPNSENIDILRYISYKNDPMGFLLSLCDMLHDWGRHNLENLSQAGDTLYNPTQLKRLDTEDNCIIFYIEIEPPPQGNNVKEKNKNEKRLTRMILQKKQYIARIFSRLKFINGHDIIIRFRRDDKEDSEFKLSTFHNLQSK